MLQQAYQSNDVVICCYRDQLLDLGFDLDNYGPLIQPHSEKDLESTYAIVYCTINA